VALRALIATDLVRSYGARRVLDGITLTASPAERVGLIGENGAGKSTLLRLLAGVEDADAGTVQRPEDLGYLAQDLPYRPGVTVQRVVDDALRESHDVLRGLDEVGAAIAARPDDADLLARYGVLLERAQDHDAWDADRRADLVLTGLGLGEIPRDRTLAEISGGQRRRLALAALLVRRPSALLLDEPTNHLDDAAAGFVEEQLRAMNGVVVVASHDRAFLDAVCSDLIDLDPAVAGPTRYGGGYTGYQQSRRAERERWERRFADEQDELAALRHAVAVTARGVAHDRPPRDNEKMGYGHRGGRVQSQISRRVRDAARRLDELERDQVRKPPAPLRFRAPVLTAPAPGTQVVTLRDVQVPGRLRLDRLDVGPDDHLLITGANGAGKSTLLSVLAGRLTASGQVLHRPGLRIGYLPQDTRFAQPGRTAQQTYAAAVGERVEAVPLRALGLIAPGDLGTPVGALSLGQQRRLALAIVLADPPDLLLLDEPTNHLSPLLADELQDAFDAAPGALVVASHDRWLRRRWQGPQLALADVEQRELTTRPSARPTRADGCRR
jgi:macrolide transport system ATP-binding/permease protein